MEKGADQLSARARAYVTSAITCSHLTSLLVRPGSIVCTANHMANNKKNVNINEEADRLQTLEARLRIGGSNQLASQHTCSLYMFHNSFCSKYSHNETLPSR